MTNLKDIITPKEKPSAFETLKKMFEEAKDADCLIQDIYWIKEALIDLQKESKNAEELLKNKQFRLVLLEDEMDLVTKDNRVMLKNIYHTNYGVYQKDGIRYLVSAECMLEPMKETKPSAFHELLGYEFIESCTKIEEVISQAHDLKFLSKKGRSPSYAVERFTKFGGMIWHNENSSRVIPKLELQFGGHLQVKINGEWKTQGNTSILPRTDDLVNFKEAEDTNFKVVYSLYLKETNLVPLQEDHKVFLTIGGGDNKPIHQITVYSKSDREVERYHESAERYKGHAERLKNYIKDRENEEDEDE